MLNCLQASDLCDEFHKFGFKKKHSASLGCSVFKNVVDYYRSNGSYIFVTFLDLSKAVDSVNHLLLLEKLTDLKFQSNVIKLLAYWYAHQQLNVRWKTVVTSSFYTKNGTRQGSVYRLISSQFKYVVYLQMSLALDLAVTLVVYQYYVLSYMLMN